MPEGGSSRDTAGADDVRYSPGAGWLVRAGDVAVLLPADADAALLERLWKVAGAKAGLVDITAELVRHGLSSLPDVAVAVLDGDNAHLVLRGRALARTASAEHDAVGWTTWRELSLPVEGLSVTLGEVANQTSLPLSGGIVLAGTLTWTAGVTPHAAGAVEAVGTVEAVGASPEPARTASPALTHEAFATPVETLRDEDLRAVVVQAAVSDADAAEQEASSEEDSYDRLFGATDFVSRPQEELVEPAPPDAPGPVTAEPPTPPVAQAPTQPAEVSVVVPPPGLIAAVPTWGAPDALAGPDDVEGFTVSRTGLRASPEPGPTVHGVRCPQGHANPPELVVCRQCALEIPAQAVTTMPRPPLGALLLETEVAGAPRQIVLDGTLIVGRRPSVDVVGDTVPRLVVVPSPDQDLSRNHARIAVEGWHVMVTDLGSTNGTVVTLPGEEPQRLHPDRPAMITPGTRVTLAEVITYRYEIRP